MNDLRENFKDILRDNISCMDRESARYYVENDAIPESGSVSGLIYYSETESLAREYHDEMVKAIHDSFGPLEKCPTMNDLTWMAWSAILPEIADEVIEENNLEIKVPRAMVVALSEINNGLFMDAYAYVKDISENRVEIDTSIAQDVDDFLNEMKAYIFYKVNSDQDMNEIEDACLEIEQAYIDDEEYVELVAS